MSFPPCTNNSFECCFTHRTGSCMICRIHLYFAFTVGHLNHIRIYYRHADLVPAENTNHDKLEEWLHKHTRLYITSYKQNWIKDISCSSSIYMAGVKTGVSLHLCLSLTSVLWYLNQTTDVNRYMWRFIYESIHHSADRVPTLLVLKIYAIMCQIHRHLQ